MSDKKGKAKINKMNNANSGTNTATFGNNGSSENFNTPIDIPATPFRSCPETAEEMINTYGTYNVQATANSVNDYPSIAQGTTPRMKDRPLRFYRNGDDPNPASDMSGEDCT